VWVAVAGLVAILVLTGIFKMLSRPQVETGEPPVTAETVKPVSQVPEKKVEKKEPEPIVQKPVEKPMIVQGPAPAAPAKPVELPKVQAPKPEPKVQIPAAIQSQLQKQAESAQAQAPKPVSKGENVIVIATYTRQEDLTPVAAYFRQNGIETVIIKEGSYYQLVTQERFENPERTGTDGFKMKQTIKRIGANYKAPNGYERFSTTPFQDAYGKKVK
jgi:hypothetical protein